MKNLRVALSQARNLPLAHTIDDPDLQTIRKSIFEPLLHLRDGTIEPGLVRSWHTNDDGMTWRLVLRTSPRFHDGSPCTVTDVLQSIERLRNARDSFGMRGPFARYLQDLEFIPESKQQLLVKSPMPTADLADIFSEIYVGKQSASGHTIIGTGPYRVDDFVESQFIRMSAVEPDENKGYSELTFLEIAEAEERYEALMSERVDLATTLELLQPIPERDNLIWQKTTNTLSVACFLNGFEAPFSEPKARLAINLAVDVRSIIQKVWHGLAKPAATVVSPYHLGFPSDLAAFGYDPLRAKELFATCAMPDRLVLKTPLYMPDRSLQVSELVQQHLSKIGIEVEIDVGKDRPQYARDVAAKRAGHMAIFDSTPYSTYRVLQEKISGRTQGVWWQGVQDEKADELIDVAHRTVREKDRTLAYSRCLSWLHKSPHWLYLFHPKRLFAHHSAVTGVTMNHIGVLELGTASHRRP